MASSRAVTAQPLTTVFTPPAWCKSVPYTSFRSDGGIMTAWRHMDTGDEHGNSCYPPYFSQQHAEGANDIYSPGVCPHDWTAAQWSSGADGAMTSWCCPTFASYNSNGGCETIFTEPTTIAKDETTNVTVTTFVGADWYVKVAWASSDLDKFSPRSAPLLNSASATSVSPNAVQSSLSAPGSSLSGNTPTPTHTSSATSVANTTSHGLSTGAKAGIGVGIAIGIIATLAIALICLRQRKRQKRIPVAVEGEKEGVHNKQREKFEPDSSMIHEVNGVGKPAEADGSRHVAELDANSQGHWAK